MKKIKYIFKISMIILVICGFLAGIGYLNYKVWRAEHPDAPTWTYFTSNKGD